MSCDIVVMLWQNIGFTYVKEGASMLQYELTGVWFILTVIYIDVEFISLEKRRKVRIYHNQNQKKSSRMKC